MEEEEWKRGRGEDGRKSLENVFEKRKLSKTAPPHPFFSFNRNRLDPSAPLSRHWGGATGVRLGSDSNQILKLS